ncbi:MAG: elongation factor G-like protein [Leptospira sp.]|nr:elongation factor G-like protein [Leptospira sp.]
MNYVTIGIFAHIDSGKTTLTEQILFQANLISAVGNIEDGTTESDSLSEEIERGISIRSSFHLVPWVFENKEYKLQFVDTPGHIDFRNQVTDILPAIEYAIIVLEAGSLVQSQARLIIEECKAHNIPMIFFINKLDKFTDFLDNLIDLEDILGKSPVVLFEGESDLTHIKFFPHTTEPFSDQIKDELIQWSDELVISSWENTSSKDKLALKGLIEGTNVCKLYPAYGGSAKSGAGVRELLDLVCLLTMVEKKGSKDTEQFVLARRIHPDNGRYSVIYTKDRISFPFQYKSKSDNYRIAIAYKLNENTFERITEADASMLYVLPFDPKYVCLPGFNIMSPKYSELTLENGQFLRSPFLLNLEPELSEEKEFWLTRLSELSWEDPSYVTKENGETGQIELSGRGELHLEIGVQRIQENTKKKLHISAINIARFERFKKVTHKVALEHRAFEDSKSSGTLTAFLEDTADFSKQVAFEVSLPEEVKNSIETAFYESASVGFFGYDVLGVRLRVIAFDMPLSGREFAPSLLKVAVHIGMKEGFHENTEIIGPQTELEILVDAIHVGVVLSELNRRSAKIHSVDEERAGKSRLKATASAQNMLGFSGALRNMTKGIGISWERTALTSEIYAVLKE